MSVLQIVNGLKASVKSGSNPFFTYAEFARTVGLSDKYPPAWANRNTLDEAANMLKSDPQVGLDLTFLIRNATTKYPSVIDGKPYDPNNPSQKIRARAVADQIIQRYGLNVPNPY
jgi:hypothetical protein